MTTSTLAGLYLRISDDRTHTSAGVTRQEHDCRALAHHRGWTVTDVYTENDTSAYTRRRTLLPDGTTALRVIRPEFRRLLADLTHGRITAVIGYDLDRVARDPRDLEDLIDAAETTHRPVLSVTGNLDLSHDAGITMARVAVAIANQASRDTSRRVRRAKEAAVAQGKWLGGGKRAYGWTPDHRHLVPHEAEVLRGIADHLLAGGSLLSAVADLNARGVPTVTGGAWCSSPLARMITRPAVAGYLEHRGAVVGKAPWPAILDETTWAAVRAEMASRPRGSTALRWWLAGVIRCTCGARMRGNDGGYVCATALGGCARRWVNTRDTEYVVGGAIVERLRSAPPPRVPARVPVVDDGPLVELAGLWGAGEISLGEYRAARAAVLARVAAQTAPPPVRLPAWASPGDVVARWPELVARQRQQVAAALLEAVVVHPAPDRRFRPGRLELRWR